MACMNDPKPPSVSSLESATKSRASFSGHGNALGAAGKRVASHDPDNYVDLREPGQSVFVSPKTEGTFDSIVIGGAWDNVVVEQSGFFSKLLKKALHKGVDLDLGCLYELSDGTRGCLQAFGNKHGFFNKPPFIRLSGDERTGDKDGFDEYIRINGKHWDKIKRLVVYIYIYDGVANWKSVNPKIILDIPGEKDLVVSLSAHEDHLALCAIGGLENDNGAIKLTNYTEYFPGHAELDRAFGFGLDWADGVKDE
jgi:tellurite resistance protein TerA